MGVVVWLYMRTSAQALLALLQLFQQPEVARHLGAHVGEPLGFLSVVG